MTGKLKLPDVTLVMIETREHTLARMAIEDCLDQVEFGDVIIVTDRPLEFAELSHRGVYPLFKTVEDWKEKVGWSREFWLEISPMLRTTHALNIQWDSWVVDVSKWSDEFLEYDYIGAPWWYKDGMNVGNGGFSLISTRLRRWVRDHQLDFPVIHAGDDDLFCRKYRPSLQHRGFVWAPEKVAHNFAFECCRPDPEWRSFGFHAMFNWGEVLPPARLRERTKIAMRSDYITNPKGVIWRAFVSKNSDLVDELLMEAGKELLGDNYGERRSISSERVS